MSNKQILALLCAVAGGVLWSLNPPSGVDIRAWHLFAVFVFTILGLITKFIPMGTLVFVSMAILTLTNTLTFSETFAGFANETVWLIVFAFFIARGFIKTGLGKRVSYQLMAILGKNTLGMAYGMTFTDLILAPAIPSATARSGGIIYPVVTALAKSFNSTPQSNPYSIGAYLIQVSFQASAVTSAMFLTSMAGNPMVQEFAKGVGISITWGSWALAAIVPGMISLLLIPLLLYKLYPPEIKHTPEAKSFAKEHLKTLGPISKQEKVMIIAFVALITLWVLAPFIKVGATVTALLGLVFLLLTNVLSWDDILNEKGAWDTMVWFAALVAMAAALNKLGFMSWFSEVIVDNVSGFNWISGFTIISLVYFYTHYLFASNVAHITAMYPPFLLVSVGIGTPPALAALVLGFFSSLFGALTPYGSGPAPIFYGSGYVKSSEWWKLGLYTSILNIVIWILIGGLWWYSIGLLDVATK
ncbi:MAG: DASS family sodium-coupled anion symporter [Chlamydiae bacterium]|nr:DASS family sodium-coupled anion symporter [Chlamydiota bacterium]